MPYLQICNLGKKVGELNILQDINLNISKGHFVSLLGPSGCGKSTLLRCLAGLDSIDQGEVYLNGKNITNTKPAHRNIGMIFQQYSLFPTKTVFDNIAFGLKIKKMPKELIKKEVFELLELIDLVSSAKKYPSQLSGGEQQRVALARSLIVKPKMILFDEPLSAIDAKLRRALQIKIKAIHEKLNMTSIFVTHDQQEAMLLADTIYLMNKGKIEQFGSPRELYHSPKSLFVARFIGEHNIISEKDCQALFNHKINDTHIVISPESILIKDKTHEINNTALITDVTFLGGHEQITLDCCGVILKCNRPENLTDPLYKNQLVNFSIDFDSCVTLSN